MNRLPRPEFDDAAALQSLANNSRVASFPKLLGSLAAITAGYAQYQAAEGNPLVVAPVSLEAEVEGFLKAHYASPPNDLRYITGLRLAAEQRVCPMCGSLHRGTLDHLLPKEDYAAFAVLSLNLVPACKCNIKRGRTVVGDAPDERILHPYFDDCLSDRLIAARFDDLGLIPKVGLQLRVAPGHPQYNAIAFHKKFIVERSAVLKYLADKWAHLCQRPRRIIRALRVAPTSLQELNETLLEELELLDEEHGGRNNWDSVFIGGLLDPHVAEWLYERLTAPGREADAPLVF